MLQVSNPRVYAASRLEVETPAEIDVVLLPERKQGVPASIADYTIVRQHLHTRYADTLEIQLNKKKY